MLGADTQVAKLRVQSTNYYPCPCPTPPSTSIFTSSLLLLAFPFKPRWIWQIGKLVLADVEVGCDLANGGDESGLCCEAGELDDNMKDANNPFRLR